MPLKPVEQAQHLTKLKRINANFAFPKHRHMKIGINMVTGSLKKEDPELQKEPVAKAEITLEDATKEANHLINTTYKFIDEHKELLNAEELKATEQIMQQAYNAIVARDKELIQKLTENLDEQSRQLAKVVATH